MVKVERLRLTPIVYPQEKYKVLKSKKQLGFTLVELLIALTILAFVIVLCASGFTFATRVWDRVDQNSSHIDNLHAVQGFLRTSLSHSLVRDRLQVDQSGGVPESQLEQLFFGDAHNLSYISYSPQYGTDDYLYRYRLLFDAQKNNLVLSYSPYNIKTTNEKNSQNISLVDGVKSLQIEYFSGFSDDQSQSSWLTSWDDLYTLPLLVKVSVEFFDNTKSWPELVIPLRHGPYVLR